MTKNDNIIKTYPHLVLYVALNLYLCVISASFLSIIKMDYGQTTKNIHTILAVISWTITLIVFLYTTFSGWNAAVRFDNEKAYQKRWGKLVTWYWKDCTDIKARTNRPYIFWSSMLFPKFKLYSSKHNKVLVFVLNKNLIRNFTNLCDNDEICKKYKDLLAQCDFPFPYKYDE